MPSSEPTMPEKELLTIKDLAEELGAPESTVRHWRDQFKEFLPSVGEGKKKRYRKSAIEVLRFAKGLFDRNETATEIREALSREYPRNVNTVAEDNRKTSTTPHPQNRNLEGQEIAAQFVDQLLERVQGILQEQNRRMESLEADNRELRERLARLEEQQKTAAPQQQRSAIAAASSRDQIVAYLIRLRSEGLSYRAIANRLNSEGIQGLRGGIWDGKTVSRILRKEGIE
jgi:DNA-binding transcriptional MerR regulator